jgi:hypothetical protein
MSESDRQSHRERALDRLGALAAMGITSVPTPLAITGSVDEYLDYVSWFSNEVIASFG